MTDPGEGCAYLIDDAAGRHDCGALRRPCSPYCAEHHAICYVVIGSRCETGLLRRFEYLADKGGKGRHPLGARTDKSRLLAVLGISESEYVTRFTSPTQTDWVMRCTPRKVLRTAERDPVVLPPAKRAAGAADAFE
jgi:hypothetical protein